MGMVALVNPVVAVSLGVLIVGETLDVRQWAGILVILLSLLLMKLPQNLRWNSLKARG